MVSKAAAVRSEVFPRGRAMGEARSEYIDSISFYWHSVAEMESALKELGQVFYSEPFSRIVLPWTGKPYVEAG